MPFKSEKQRRFMYMKHPEIAKKWSKKYGSKIQPKKKAKKKERLISNPPLITLDTAPHSPRPAAKKKKSSKKTVIAVKKK